jgi:ubiquinone/menaquinone biosynthesis C-methylase UbiE
MNLEVGSSAGVSRLYDSYYEGGDEAVWRSTGARDKVDHIEALCAALKPETVLEVGCGEGAVLAELDRRGFASELFGVEISNSGVRATKARGLQSLKSVAQFSGYELPFNDQSIDLVIATHVLEHVEHERLFLRELARVGKRVFVEVPLEDTLRVATAVDNHIGHINFYNQHTFKNLLQSAGLRVESSGVFDHSVDLLAFGRSRASGRMRKTIRSLAHRLSPSIAERVFTYHMAVLARPQAA